MTETIQEVLSRASLFLQNHQREPKVAEILLLHHANFTKTDLLLNLREPVDPDVLKTFEVDLKTHTETGKPVQHLTGVEQFYGRTFNVNENVLIPRPETEELVELILTRTKTLGRPFKIIDIGTGSGVIPITLKKEDPTLMIDASDISPEALEVARTNAKKHDAEIQFHQSDFLQKWLGSSPAFDLIVSNPPYIPYEHRDTLQDTVKNFDPELALFADDDGLAAYKKIIEQAKSVLKPGGYLAFEIGHTQGDQIEALIKSTFLNSEIERIKDINKKDRIIFSRIRV